MTDETPIAHLVAAVLTAQGKIDKLEKPIAVLFADLCDSTSYKLLRGDVDGLLKTYRHAQIVEAAVAQQSGIIVKYIGDEVMVTFEGDNANVRAIAAAVDIQATIRLVNAEIKGSPDERIASKIGINYGNALLVQFPGHEAKDPQGKVVDAAARIIALCQPGQILCSEQVLAGLPKEFRASDAYTREAKGIASGVRVFEVIQEGVPPQVPKLMRHNDVRTNPIRERLKQANIYEHTARHEAAATQYDAVIGTPFPNGDKAHFAANYRKARILFRHRKTLRADFEDIIALAQQATESFPESGAAKAFYLVVRWHLAASSHGGGGEPNFDATHWNQFINEARQALELCHQDCDFYGEMVSINLLAFFISERLAISPNEALLREARQLCEMLQNMIQDLQSNFVPAFYETYAGVLGYSKNPGDIDKAISLAKQSSELRSTSQVFRTIARLLDIQDKMGEKA